MRRILAPAVAALAGAALLATRPPAVADAEAIGRAVPSLPGSVLPQGAGSGASPAKTTPAVNADAATLRAEPDRGLLLPDGSSVPALNGVRQPAHLPWPPHRPWSPITGTETEADGVEWYVHADGSRTTTQMHWHHQLGRLDPVTVVFNPVEPTQLLPIALAPSFPNPRP